MAYFTNPHTEEELKEQYRKLLIRYDYRNPKNEKVIAEIRKKYEQTLKQIKYDSGYRTTTQQIKEGVAGFAARQSAEYEKEEDRKRALQNKPYTKQDLLNMVEEQKKFIDDTVYQILKLQDSGYNNLKKVVMNGTRGKDIYDVYSGVGLVSLSPPKLNAECKDLHKMKAMKERMEYCVLVLAGRNEKKAEIMLCQVEDQLGNYIKQIFQQYEKKLVDPIKEMEAMKEARWDAKNTKFLKILASIFKILVCMLLCLFTIEVIYYTFKSSDILSAFHVSIVVIIIWIVVVAILKWFDKLYKKSKQRGKRVRTAQEQSEQDTWISIIAHFLSHLFR